MSCCSTTTLIVLCLSTATASAQSLIGLRIGGPDQVAEEAVAYFNVIAEFEDGMEWDVTPSALMWTEPGEYAEIGVFGDFEALAVPEDSVEMIHAIYSFGTEVETAELAVTILDLPAAGMTLDFDGAGDFVRVPSSPALEPEEEITIEVWIRPDSTGGRNSKIIRTDGIFTDEYYLGWQSNYNNRLIFRLSKNGGSQTLILEDDTPTTTYLGSWHHVAAVYSAITDCGRLYVDGQLKAEVTDSGFGLMVCSDEDLFFGNYNAFSGEEFDGLIDEVRIWSVARSAEEIYAAMYRPLVGDEEGLAGYWRFDEVGQYAYDSSQSGNHGILGVNDSADGDSADPLRLISDAPVFSGSLVGVDIIGPEEIAENWQASYHAVITFEDGTTDGTFVVDWSVVPPEAGSINGEGVLSSGDMDACEDVAGLVSAVYTDLVGEAEGGLPITILRTGGAGNALEFDGIDDRVYVPISPSLAYPGAGGWAVEAWVYRYPAGDGVIAGQTSGFNHAPYALSVDNGYLRFRVDAQAGVIQFVATPSPIPTEEWLHVVGVYDQDEGKMRLFIGGEEVSCDDTQLVMETNLSIPVSVGATNNSGCCHFGGMIDEIRIWQVARTQTEVQENMFTELAGNEPGLVAYWQADEADGQTLFDLTENGNDGWFGTNWEAPDSADPTWLESSAPIGPPPPIDGDVNLDGLSDGDDISWFIGLVYAGQFGDPERITHADFNCNDIVDVEDIEPFVAALLGCEY